MKHLACILLALVIILAGCRENYNNFDTGYGDIEINLSVDTSIVNIAGAKPISIQVPSEESIAIEADGNNGHRKSWKNIEDFNKSRKMIPVDDYLFSATSGDRHSEGFTEPAFHAEEQARIFDNELTTVDLDCKVASTLVSASLPKESNLLKGMSLRIKSDKGEYVDFGDGESRAASVMPGDIKAEITLTDNSGRTATIRPFEIKGTSPQQHYEIRASIHESAIGFVYDEASLAKPTEIKISDKLFSSPSPEIKTEGLKGNSMTNYEDNLPPSPITCTVTAANGLRHLYITLISDNYPGNPWQEESDIIGLKNEAAEGYGISISGNESHSRLASIDFTNLISQLPADGTNPASHTIVVQAEDDLGKICDTPAIIKVETKPINLSIDNPSTIGIDDAETTITVNYNGESFGDYVALQYSDVLSQSWQPLEIKSIDNKGDGKYAVLVKVPDDKGLMYLRATYKDESRYSDKVLLKRNLPDFTATCREENIWSSKADIYISGEEAERMVKFLNVYIKEANGDWHPAVIEKSPEEKRITVSTLMPSTSYVLTINTSSDNSKTIGITTESALSLPNGSFEDGLKETINIERINCGGRYSNINSWMPTYNTTSIKVREAKGWASINAKTCSSYAKTSNTWFKIPTSEIITTAHDGAYAMRIRNAAWDINGVEPPRDVRTDKIYYSSKVPHIANRSAGKVFLGSYTFFANGNERYDEGIEFSSRPTSLSGYYYYRQDIHDLDETGLVTIKLLHEDRNGSVIIGEGTGKLPASTSFTAFNVPITYKIRDKRATKLCVMLSSSNHASTASQAEETRNIKTTDNLEKGISVGAELVIDDLKLLYE